MTQFCFRAFARPLLSLPLLVAGAGGALAACAVEDARYVQRGGQASISFIPAKPQGTAASDLFLRLDVGRGALWFRMHASQGYGAVRLEPIGDPARADPDEGPQPLARRQGGDAGDDGEAAPGPLLLPMRRDMTEIADPPRKGAPPPAWLLLPDLGLTLWYEPASVGAGGERIALSRSAFALAGCGARKARR